MLSFSSWLGFPWKWCMELRGSALCTLLELWQVGYTSACPRQRGIWLLQRRNVLWHLCIGEEQSDLCLGHLWPHCTFLATCRRPTEMWHHRLPSSSCMKNLCPTPPCPQVLCQLFHLSCTVWFLQPKKEVFGCMLWSVQRNLEINLIVKL